MDEDMEQPVVDSAGGEVASVPLLLQLAQIEGDISGELDAETLAKLGAQVKEDYDRDLQSRDEWEKVAKDGLRALSQDYGSEAKDFPWPGASNVRYPLLIAAVQQFNARAYPAIIKGDEAVTVKVVGADKGMPQFGLDGQPVLQVQGMPVAMTPAGPAVMTPQGPQPLPDGVQPEPVWLREPGAKAKRAKRVADLMNATLFYRMDNWEGETDALVSQLAAIGVEFRKVWFDPMTGEHRSVFVPALNLVVNNEAKSLESAPQVTERLEGVFPHEIRRDQLIGLYRDVDFGLDEDKEPRLLLEQYCRFDLDRDGVPEPYIVTLDDKSGTVLRVIANFGPEDIRVTQDGAVGYIEPRCPYVKYEFMPHPEAKFYNIGLAHILHQYGEVINTLINQMIDGNTAATAGGGFIGSGLRIQGQGQSSSIRFRPGEYKTVPVSGAALRDGIYERTFPQINAVMFNLLDLILGAAKEMASIKDVLTGDASNNGQVGTTLALIEQGLQVFTAVYKRIYRGLRNEFAKLFANMGRYATEATQQDYVELLDDPAADFAKDFNAADQDIRPVSDPTAVTKQQKLARGQFILQTLQPLQLAGGDIREAMRRVYESADIEDVDKLLPQPQPNPAQEMAMQLDMAGKQADIEAKQAKARRDDAEAQATVVDSGLTVAQAQIGAMTAGYSDAA